ncbi:hypothetical protein [Streptomyces sp. 021-4]|uniref:hypothetical protein n=1 Tax=Streptomyces sp. 021-4 TaxID=2789260 RepID=UPI0039F57E84
MLASKNRMTALSRTPYFTAIRFDGRTKSHGALDFPSCGFDASLGLHHGTCKPIRDFRCGLGTGKSLSFDFFRFLYSPLSKFLADALASFWMMLWQPSMHVCVRASRFA